MQKSLSTSWPACIPNKTLRATEDHQTMLAGSWINLPKKGQLPNWGWLAEDEGQHICPS